MFIGYRFAMKNTFEINEEGKLMCSKNLQI